jgi:transcription-repair coupling factor (superfamily II helicase)
MHLTDLLQKEKDFLPLLSALKKENKPVLVTGITSSIKALFPAAVIAKTDEKALILLSDEGEAKSFHKALSSVFSGALFFPARDFSLVRVDSASRDFSLERLQVLSRLSEGDFDCVVTTFEAACQATMPPEVMKRSRKKIAVGDEISKEDLLNHLAESGYESTHRVEGAGQFATRGDIIDVFLAGSEKPLRIELFGDEIDAMGTFDVLSQRRIENLREVVLTPAREINFSDGDKETVCAYLKEEMEKSLPEEKEKRVFIRSLSERIRSGMEFAGDLFLPLIYRFATLFDYFTNELIFLYGQSDGENSVAFVVG